MDESADSKQQVEYFIGLCDQGYFYDDGMKGRVDLCYCVVSLASCIRERMGMCLFDGGGREDCQ